MTRETAAFSSAATSGRVRRGSIITVALITVALLLIAVADPLTTRTTVVALDTATVLTSIAATVATLLAGIRRTNHRRAWLLIGLGSAFYTAGEAIWFLYEVVLNRNPFPSWADVAYLAATPFYAAGFFSFATQWGRLGWARVTANGLIAFLLATALTWHFALLPLYQEAGTPLLNKALSMAYPITDLALIATIVVGLREAPTRQLRTAIMVLALSFFITALSDIGLSVAEITVGYEGGSIIDAGWPIAHLFLALAAVFYLCGPPASRRHTADRMGAWSAQAVPLASSVGTILALVAADRFGGFTDDWFFLALISGVGLATVVRQTLVHFDVAHLNHELANARDHLEQRVAARTTQLRESEARFRSFTDAAAEGIITTDAAGRITLWNSGAVRIFGRAPGDVVGRLFSSLFVAEDEARLTAAFDDLRSSLPPGGAEPPPEFEALRADGSKFPAELSLASWETAGERSFGLLVRDISERRRIEASRSRLAGIVSATTDIVISVDTAWRLLEVNESGRRLFGHLDSAAKLKLADYVPQWALQVLLEQAVPAAVRDGSWSGELALTGAGGEEMPVSLVVLAHRGDDGRLAYFSAIARDITERKRHEAQLQRLAHFDPATGLLNRRSFEFALSEAAQSTIERGGQGAVLFIDLDRFKSVNDNLGHRAGDELLASLARRLRHAFDEDQLVARLHGDEFAVLIPGATAEDGAAAAGWVASLVRDHVVVAGGQRLNVTASIGVALYPEHGSTAEELLVRADHAMYRAKEHGDRFAVFSPSTAADTLSGRLPWEQRIRDALREDRFTLHFQPIRALRGGHLHYEALLRMIDRDGAVIAPTPFLEVAERSGLIHSIDRWVAKTAVQTIAEYAARGQDLRLEVNLSGQAFADPLLLDQIQAELKRTKIDAAQLTFEVTETSAIADLDEARRFISRLREFGCRFALDDFGTGFSSLWMLKELPVDYLKIDGSFIRDLEHNTADQEMVKAISHMAKALGKQTIAEYVTTEATMRLLEKFGVDFAQGYAIGEPQPAPVGLEPPRVIPLAA